jgi:hypothetical protein
MFLVFFAFGPMHFWIWPNGFIAREKRRKEQNQPGVWLMTGTLSKALVA